MDSICGQGFHQGQIPSMKEEQVTLHHCHQTAVTTDREGFKLQPLKGHSHCSGKLIDLFQGCDRGREEPIDQFKGTNRVPGKNSVEDLQPPTAGRLPTTGASLQLTTHSGRVTATSNSISHHRADS